MTSRAIIAGARADADRDSAAYQAAVAQSIKVRARAMPYDVIAQRSAEIKAGTELLGEGRLIGDVREVLQPAVDKNGSLSSDLAPALVRTSTCYNYILPLKPTLVDAWTAYLAAHKVDKPDIWAARGVDAACQGPYTPVEVAIWTAASTPSSSRNLHCERQRARHRLRPLLGTRDGELQPIPDALKSKVPPMKAPSRASPTCSRTSTAPRRAR